MVRDNVDYQCFILHGDRLLLATLKFILNSATRLHYSECRKPKAWLQFWKPRSALLIRMLNIPES